MTTTTPWYNCKVRIRIRVRIRVSVRVRVTVRVRVSQTQNNVRVSFIVLYCHVVCCEVCGWKEFDVVIGTVPRDQYC